MKSLRPAASALVALGALAACAAAAGAAARATVAPKPVQRCPAEDPIEGTWHARQFLADVSAWVDFTVTIARDAGSATAVRGTITVEGWSGGARQTEPGPCSVGEHYVVQMQAEGTFAGGHLDFAGRAVRVVRDVCGDFYPSSYNADHLVGAREGEGLVTFDYDGGRDSDPPLAFTRAPCR